MRKLNVLVLLSFLILPFLSKAQQCISNVQLQTSECEQGDILHGFLFFEHSTNVDSVSVYYDGLYFGNHPTEFLPITLYPLYGDGVVHNFLVVDTNDSSCRDSIDMLTFCSNAIDSCNAEIFDVSYFCVDSLLHITLNYSFTDPVTEPYILVNGMFIADAMVGQDIVQTITVPTDPNSVYEIKLTDAQFQDCSDTEFLQVAPCQPNCVQDYDYGAVTCNSDGTYNIDVYVGLTEPETNIYIDGEFVAMATPFDSTTLYNIANLPSDSTANTYQLTFCHVNNPSCCTSILYDDPNCVPSQCEIESQIVGSSCNSGTGAPQLEVLYTNLNNQGDSKFYINGIFVADADQGENILASLLAPFADPNGFYTVSLESVEDSTCTDIQSLGPIFCACDSPIEIFDISPNCTSDTTYTLSVILKSLTPWRPYFIVDPSGTEHGPFSGNPSTQGDFIYASIDLWSDVSGGFIVYDEENFNCFADFETGADCDDFDNCYVDIHSYDFSCEGDDIIVSVNYSFENPFSEGHVFINGEYIQNANDGVDQFLSFIIPNGQAIDYVIQIKDAEFLECSDEIVFTPDCLNNEECEINYIELGAIECNDSNNGTYDFDLYFGIENYNANQVDVYVNNVYYAPVPYTTTGVSITGISPNPNSDFGIVKICSQLDQTCCLEYEFLQPNCDTNEPCSISDIALEFECFGNNEYIAILTFDHTGIEGDTVEVRDYNGNLLGYFDTNEQPIIINNTPPLDQSNTFGVIIYSPLDEQCVSESILYTVPCEPNCDIVWIDPGATECNPNGTYNVDIFYGFKSSNGEFVVAYINGVPQDSIPIIESANGFTISNIQATPGSDTDVITLCIDGNPECCSSVDVLQPNCEIEDCYIEVLDLVYECNGEGSYEGVILFESNNTSGFYELYINGALFEVIETPNNQIPFGPFANGVPYNFSIKDAQDDGCFAEGDLFYQDCPIDTIPCSVDFISIDSIVCNPNGTYGMLVSYETSNTGSSSQVNVLVNNTVFDTYPLNGQIFISDITPRPNSDYDIINICVDDNLDCCKTIEYLNRACDSECYIGEVNAIYQCVGPDLYEGFLVFDAQNTSETYDLFIDGQLFGTFQSGQNEIYFGLLPNGQVFNYEIVDNEDPSCFITGELFYTECSSGPCVIEYVEADSILCYDNGTYSMSVVYDSSNSFSDFVNVTVNNQFEYNFANDGHFTLTDIPFTNTSDFDFLFICMENEPDCCIGFEYQKPDCEINNDPCSIEFIEVAETICNSDGTFDLLAFYDIENENNNFIDVFINQEFFGFYSLADQVVLENIPVTDTDFQIVTICLNDNPDCCLTVDFLQPDCNSTEECSINNIEVDYVCLADTLYDALVYFSYEGLSNVVEIIVNGQSEGYFEPDNQPIQLGNYFTSSFYLLEIRDTMLMSCAAEHEIYFDDCDDGIVPCAIQYIEPGEKECNGDGTFDMTVYYGFENANSSLIDVWLSGNYFGSYTIGSQVLLENIPISLTNDIKTIQICIDQMSDCCLAIDYQQPDCGDVPDSCSVEIHTVDWFCEGSIPEEVYLQLDISTNMDPHLVMVNGEVVLETDFLEQFTTVGPVAQNLDHVYEVQVINLTDENCTDIFILEDADCPEECFLDDLVVEFECDENTGQFVPYLSFNYEPGLNEEVVVNVNGINVGFFDAAQQPIILNSYMSNSADEWLFTVTSATDSLCAIQAILEDLECGGDCLIGDINVEVECDSLGLVYFYLDFFSHNTSGEVSIVGNGNQYGDFGVDETPIQLGPFDKDDYDVWEFVIFDFANEECQAVIELDEINCIDTNEAACLVEDIEVYNIDCIGDNEYSMTVDFDVPGAFNVPFTFFLNGELMNSATSATLPLNLIGLVPNDSSHIEMITICLDGLNEDCCFDFTYETPACLFDAVDESIIDSVELSPNPTKDWIHIHNIPQEIIGLNIIDNLGRRISQFDATSSLQVDVSSFTEGIYIVQFFTADNRVMSKRFVKMN